MITIFAVHSEVHLKKDTKYKLINKFSLIIGGWHLKVAATEVAVNLNSV